jgi:hypothetical protein
LAVLLLAASCNQGEGTGLLQLSIAGDESLPPGIADRVELRLANVARTFNVSFPQKDNQPLLLQFPDLPASDSTMATFSAFRGSTLVARAEFSVTVKAGKKNVIELLVVLAPVADAGVPSPSPDAAPAGPDAGTPDVARAPDAPADTARTQDAPRVLDLAADITAVGGSGGASAQAGAGGTTTSSSTGTAGSTGGQTSTSSAPPDAAPDVSKPDSAPPSFTLQVSSVGNGTGTISGSSINCGTTCSASFPENTIVSLTVTPDSLSAFVGWTGDCTGKGACEVVMSQARRVTANFTGPQALSVTKKGAGTGSVTSAPAGIACGATCSAQFKSDSEVTLTANVGDADSAFAGWSGACSGAGECKVTMSEARQITAVFTRKFIHVSAGYLHTCAIRPAGQVVCWGAGLPGGTKDPNYGQSIPPSGTFTSVSAGGKHTCGIRTDGTLACWGANQFGESTPPSGTFKVVSAGWDLSCGVRTDDTVICWGSNGYKQTASQAGTFSAVSPGTYNVCGLDLTGRILCWGELTDVVDLGQTKAPSGQFTSISATVYTTCAVRADGAVLCWGNDFDGQASPPTGSFQTVSTHNQITCGLRKDGQMICWGNVAGVPDLQTPPPGPYAEVSTGSFHACGMRPNGAIVCVGNNDIGQITLPAH